MGEIIMYGADTILEMFQKYAGETEIIAIFLCCIGWIFYCSEKENRRYLVLYGIGAAAMLNPISMELLRKLGSKGTEYRFIWLIPIIPVITYVITEILSQQKNISDKICFIILLACILYFCGDSYLKPDKLKLPETVYGIPRDTIEVSDIIEQEKQEEYVVVAMEESLQLTIRQWNASIICGISRKSYIAGNVSDIEFGYLPVDEQEEHLLMKVINDGECLDVTAMKQCLQEQSIDFVVMNKNFEMEEYMQELGCKLVGESQTYEVYATGI